MPWGIQQNVENWRRDGAKHHHIGSQCICHYSSNWREQTYTYGIAEKFPQQFEGNTTISAFITLWEEVTSVRPSCSHFTRSTYKYFDCLVQLWVRHLCMGIHDAWRLLNNKSKDKEACDIFWKEFSGERNPNPQNALTFLTVSFAWHEERTLHASKQHAPLIEADRKCEVYPLQNIDTVMKGV